MSEIEKLYENIGIGKKVMCEWTCKDSPDCNANCKHYESTQLYYPPFTAKKQLTLIKWLIQNKRLCIHKAEHSDNFYMDTLATRLDGVDNSSFEECLASMLNLIWQDLTEEEQEQIRRILNE